MLGEKVGQLVITQQLGAGGMGAVFLAQHEVIGVKRAVKFLLPEFTQNSFVVQRFLNEARAAGKLAHRNIVAVHDVGQLANGMHFIVFDYLAGQTLARFIETYGGPMPPQMVVRIVSQIANALRVAHPLGIIHRDLKPENVLLSKRDADELHVTVVDWGIALLLGDSESGPRTKSGVLVGTPAYMPPEQIRGTRVGAPADVFALGTIAYRMATGGCFPFQHDNSRDEYYGLTPTEICLRQLAGPAPDPRTRVPQISEPFAQVLLTAVDADPQRRPSPQQYALALARAVPGDAALLGGMEIVQTHAHELLDGAAVPVSRPSAAEVLAPAQVAPARVDLASRYTIQGRLGAGGMAEVFLASMTGAAGFARTVAIKRVLSGYSQNAQFAAMFTEEARIASQLSHANIVGVLDYAEDSEGRMFLVMEYVDGRDLSSLMAAAPIPYSIVNFIVAEMLRGLGHAHDLPSTATMRGIVHRDVSPHNVLLSWDGGVKVSDFGIAKARDATSATASTMIKGKPAYMSPEQANGEKLDGRSDLFSVGVVLWELLAGPRQHLFSGDVKAALAQILIHPIPAPRARPGTRADVPDDLEAITMRLLAKEPDLRYPNAAAAIEDLANCACAPRNGPAALARLLAERFPEAAAARASHPHIQVPTPPSGSSRDGNETKPIRGSAPRAPQAAVSFPAPWQPVVSTLGGVPGHVVSGRRPTRAKRIVIAASSAVVVGVLVGAIAAVTQQGGDAEPAAAARPPLAPSERPPTFSAPAMIDAPAQPGPTITIVTEPVGALVQVDGSPPRAAPIAVPAALGRRLTIEASRDGYEPARESITVDRDGQLVSLRLVARPSAVEASGSNTSATPANSSAPPRKRRRPASTNSTERSKPNDLLDVE